MLHTREEVIQHIQPLLFTYTNIDLCILYGSAARDTLHTGSDIDLAVGSSSGISYSDRFTLSQELTAVVGREVTVLDISSLNGVILQEVLTKGITIKNTDTAFKAELLIQMYEFTEDLLPAYMAGAKKRIRGFTL
ncbi:MAG: nucleotidyltransferase domain-containing protein [Sphaerochaetaceae bacterium]|nr:nucleotidyltransferase domain-containing protein [Sphaerochaetaceae bacterium]